MKYLLEIRSKAMPGRDQDYDTWYENIHMPDVLKVPGFNACTRYEIAGAEGGRHFVSMFEVETDDPQDLLNTLFAAVPGMELTDAVDPESASFTFMVPIGGGRMAAQ